MDELYDRYANLYNEIFDELSDSGKSKLEDLFCILYEMKEK